MSKRKPNIEVPNNKAVFSLRIVEIRAEEMRVDRGVRPVAIGDETGTPIVFDFIFDVSPSMSALYGELADCFNTITIPSLQKSAERYHNALRIGCMLFSSAMVPAWRGFKTLDDLGDNPLNASMLQQPSNIVNDRGYTGGTALYRAMESGLIWTAAAMKRLHPQAIGKVAVLTDGANNQEPMTPQRVADFMGAVKDPDSFQTFIGYFKTGDGLSREQFNQMVVTTGFEGKDFYEIAPKGDKEEQRRRFRHYFDIYSKRQTDTIKA